MPARRDDEMLDLLNEAVCLRVDIHDLHISDFANVVFIII
jgi:hypothetical protein